MRFLLIPLLHPKTYVFMHTVIQQPPIMPKK